jgi:hypothetical protein
MTNAKKIDHRLAGRTGPGGNAFALMGAFSAQAKDEGWTNEEIEDVMTRCMSGNYDNLRATLEAYCNDEGDD